MTVEGAAFTLWAVLLTIFMTLKLAAVVTWSWWFVILGPTAIMVGISIVLLGLFCLLLGTIFMVNYATK